MWKNYRFTKQALAVASRLYRGTPIGLEVVCHRELSPKTNNFRGLSKKCEIGLDISFV